MSRRIQTIAATVLMLAVLPSPAFAYVGPGSFISAVGAVLAVVAGLFFAIFGFVWYPMKRIARALRGRSDDHAADFSPGSTPPSA